MAGLADELARALEAIVDARVRAALADPDHLSAVATAGGGSASAERDGAATAEDFSAVVNALALIEGRLSELEDRLRVLAEVTATVARSLDQLRPRAGGAEVESSTSDDGGARTGEA